ncbi:MAG: aspartate aminotransferase family protein [Verrucomicrobia bacterium]|nr:aspartate aminotransferase family protein [Verrucomicrobiota bacterium]MDE3100053.1 aspartate aminotransferase family protein [Verrucomicrobiota bacterium]
MNVSKKSAKILDLLARYESRNVTYMERDGSWPIVWDRAKDVWVWDAEGGKYLDLTAGFGVAAAGHANPKVVQAGRAQMARLLHAMGDVHPHARKAELARELSRITFERWGAVGGPRSGGRSAMPSAPGEGAKTIFCNSGFEAVEAAMKTAILATGRRGVIAFHGAYHGLGYGALNVTHRDFFRAPFEAQLRQFAGFARFPMAAADLAVVEFQIRNFFRRGWIGAVLVEPVQTRGGVNVPPPEFLPLLRRLCDEFGALLILDEIYTGFGRTGRWFACEHSGVTPDLICLGKALTGGFPLSACVGRAALMDAAWPASAGEAIHTSTFLGHPVGCAMALAQIAEIERLKLPRAAAELGKFLLAELAGISGGRFQTTARGMGLLAGIELRRRDGAAAAAETPGIVKALLRKGYIALPEGAEGNVISLTPPLTITRGHLADAIGAIAETVAAGTGRTGPRQERQ